MQHTNTSGLILEGIAGTGKSTTLTALLASDYWREKPFLSSYVLSEHHTLRVLETKRNADEFTKSDSLQLLDTHVSYLENLKRNLDATDWLARDRTAQKLPFIFERFHLSHVYHYDEVDWPDVADIDARLNNLGAKLCIFTIDPADIQHRIIQDYHKAGWGDYLATLGSNDQEITDHFIKKQDEILELAQKTKLPVKIIDTSKLSTNEILTEIQAFWSLY